MRALLLVTLATTSLLGCSQSTDPSPDLINGVPPIYSFVFPSDVVASAYQLPAPGLPPMATVGVRLTNTGALAARVEYGACSVAVWLYRPDTRGSAPAWQTSLAAGSACIAIAYVQTIAPGTSYQVGGGLFGASTLGDSLPAGPYLVRVAVRRRATSTGADTLIVLDGGTLNLP